MVLIVSGNHGASCLVRMTPRRSKTPQVQVHSAGVVGVHAAERALVVRNCDQVDVIRQKAISLD